MAKSRFNWKNLASLEYLKRASKERIEKNESKNIQPEISPEEQAEISEIENVFQNLDASFKWVAKITIR